ncbi:acyl-CoA thioester hydrolase, partial [Bordetella bronchiseptica]
MPPRMSVAPERALIDVDREIRIDGFGPYACIDVTAEMRMCGVPWRSRATFLA